MKILIVKLSSLGDVVHAMPAVQDIRAAIESLITRPKDGPWPLHAALGSISGAQWGRLLYRHTDYHFRQFGV